ncbi:MAG: hypothetical protein R2848_18095 [Thermomicrobiales bacterium]
MAIPSTWPILRVVLSTPEALPATRGGTSRMAAAVIGEKVIPIPIPVTISAGASESAVVEVEVWRMIKRMPIAMMAVPAQSSQRAPMRSDKRPAIGCAPRDP